MKNGWWPKLGAVLLIVFAGSLALMGSPTYLAPVKSVEDWGKIVKSGRDRVAPLTVGEWIVEKRPDVRIIDVRSKEQFDRYAIPGSENLPLDQLFTKDGIARLSKKGTHVLVCKDGSRAAEAWVVLRGMGYDAYVMDGGLQSFVDQVLEKKEDQPQDVAMKVFALREKFLGNGAAVGSAPPPPPPVAAAPVAAPRHKKKAGGC